jgi:PhnB protein
MLFSKIFRGSSAVKCQVRPRMQLFSTGAGAPQQWMKFDPYLFFNGNCREAIEFYRNTFNGKLVDLKTYSEAPMPVKKPEWKDKILFASLVIEEGASRSILLLSDVMTPDYKLGTNLQISVSLSSPERIREIFQKFEDHSKTVVKLPLARQFWGAVHGNLVDPFGIHWSFTADDGTAAAAQKK